MLGARVEKAPVHREDAREYSTGEAAHAVQTEGIQGVLSRGRATKGAYRQPQKAVTNLCSTLCRLKQLPTSLRVI